jgi:hypothetical protein
MGRQIGNQGQLFSPFNLEEAQPIESCAASR